MLEVFPEGHWKLLRKATKSLKLPWLAFKASWNLSWNSWPRLRHPKDLGGTRQKDVVSAPSNSKMQTRVCCPPISSSDIKGRTEDCLLCTAHQVVADCAVPLFAQRSCHVYQDNQRMGFRRNCSIALPLTGFPCQIKISTTLLPPGLHHHRMTLHIVSFHAPTCHHQSLLTVTAFMISRQVFWGFVSLVPRLGTVGLHYRQTKTANNSFGPEQV